MYTLREVPKRDRLTRTTNLSLGDCYTVVWPGNDHHKHLAADWDGMIIVYDNNKIVRLNPDNNYYIMTPGGVTFEKVQ
jgi:hypothetical protein